MSRWPSTRLDQCCEIVAGATPSTLEEAYWGGDICWATPKDLSELDGALISDTPRKLTAAGLQSCAASVLPVRSVLFSSRAPIGHVAINTVPMATNQGFKSFIPKQYLVHPEFLFWWLRYNRPFLESLGNGATFKEVSKAIVSRVEIALPPLPEQRRIAAILDQAETLRTQRRSALAQLDSLTQSIFLDMFGDPVTNSKGWPLIRLDQLVRPNDTINYGVVQPGDALDEGVPLVRVGDIVDGNLTATTLKRIDPTIESAYKRSRLKGDEVLLTCVGSIGVVALVDPAMMGFNIARAVARVPLSNQVDRTFVANYLRTDYVQRYFTAELRTVSQPTLNIKQICETKVIQPPLALQKTFATRIQAIETLKEKHRAALVELDALFASLQHRAFNGELTAQATTQPRRRTFAELGQLNTSKGLEALIYAAHRLPNKGHYWPLKVQYVADRRHLECHGRTLYGETHVAMPYGPVPQAAFNASRALAQGELLCEFPMDAVRAALRRDGDALVALRDADTSVLGADERESLDWAICLVADMSFDELKNQTHDSAWEKTPRNAPMAWQDIIESLAPAARQHLLEQFE